MAEYGREYIDMSKYFEEKVKPRGKTSDTNKSHKPKMKTIKPKIKSKPKIKANIMTAENPQMIPLIHKYLNKMKKKKKRSRKMLFRSSRRICRKRKYKKCKYLIIHYFSHIIHDFTLPPDCFKWRRLGRCTASYTPKTKSAVLLGQYCQTCGYCSS